MPRAAVAESNPQVSTELQISNADSASSAEDDCAADNNPEFPFLSLSPEQARECGKGCRTSDHILGHVVTLHSLSSRTDLNGRRGILQSYDVDTDRAVIQVDDVSAPVRIKHDNLFSLQDVASDHGFLILKAMANQSAKARRHGQEAAEYTNSLLERELIPHLPLYEGFEELSESEQDKRNDPMWQSMWMEVHIDLLAKSTAREIASRSELLRQLHELLRQHITWPEVLFAYGYGTTKHLKGATYDMDQRLLMAKETIPASAAPRAPPAEQPHPATADVSSSTNTHPKSREPRKDTSPLDCVPRCAWCYAEATPAGKEISMSCSPCASMLLPVYYCGRDCKVEHWWADHKRVCCASLNDRDRDLHKTAPPHVKMLLAKGYTLAEIALGFCSRYNEERRVNEICKVPMDEVKEAWRAFQLSEVLHR